MPYFDRFDICEAYLALEWDYNKGGWLHERPSNVRRGRRRGFVGESTDVQLSRMGFRAGAGFNGFASLSENGQEIYRMLEARYGFSADEDPEPDAYSYCKSIPCKRRPDCDEGAP